MLGSFRLHAFEFKFMVLSSLPRSKRQHLDNFLGVAMENRYVGDLGDFGKYGLLRWLCKPRRTGADQTLSPSLGWNTVSDHNTNEAIDEGSTIPLWPPEEEHCGQTLTLGVVWHLVPDENHNSDGTHIHYLEPSAFNQERYRDCDPILYDTLREIVRSNRRNVSSIRDCQVLPLGTRFYNAVLAFNCPNGQKSITREDRVARRKSWLFNALELTADCDLVFVDPDNGFEVKVGPYQRRGPKYVFFDELLPYLQRNQSLIIYHHIGRQGSASDQIRERLTQINNKLGRAAFALLYHRGSARAFFVVPAPRHHMNLFSRAKMLMLSPWSRHFELFETPFYEPLQKT